MAGTRKRSVRQLKEEERRIEQTTPKKGAAERRLEREISKRTGKPYKGKR